MVIVKNKKCQHGEDVLSSIRALTLTLDNRQRADFRVVDEICIPDALDRVGLSRLATRLPGRLAFWAHQVTRAKHAVRQARIELRRYEGLTDQMYRIGLDEGRFDKGMAKFKASDFGVVQARVNCDPKLHEARMNLEVLEQTLDRVEAMQFAVSQMCFIVPRLLGQMASATERA